MEIYRLYRVQVYGNGGLTNSFKVVGVSVGDAEGKVNTYLKEIYPTRYYESIKRIVAKQLQGEVWV